MTTGSFSRQGPPIGVDCCGSGSFPLWSIAKDWSGTDRQPGEPAGTPHPYLATYAKRTYGIGKHVVAGQCCLQTCFGGALGSGYTWTSNDQLKLLEKLSAQIRGESVNMSVFLGTMHQSAKLIADRAHLIRMGLMAVSLKQTKKRVLGALTGDFDPRPAFRAKRRDFRYKEYQGISAVDPNLGSSAANAWLELSYGWLPLLSDVHESMGVIAKAADGHYSRKYTAKLQRTGSPPWHPNTNYVQCTGAAVVRRKLVYEVEPVTSFKSLMAVYGLNDPASLAWELLPWSFVVDWFVPVGSYLDALALYPNLSGKWVQSTKSYVKAKLEFTGFGGYTPISPQTEEWGWFQREVGTGALQVPRPNFKSPISSDWKRAANAVSLIVQRVF